MDSNLTKSDLVGMLVNKTNSKLSRPEADDAITYLLTGISNSLLSGERVKLHNLGSLELFEGAPRLCRNVVKNEALPVPAKTRVRFVPSSVLKKRIARRDGVAS